jgi:hypothetical protein
MARTTLDIDATVLAQLRRRAAAEGKSMGRTVSELLAPALQEPVERAELAPVRWPARGMGLPLVDLEDREALWRVLDREQMRPHEQDPR